MCLEQFSGDDSGNDYEPSPKRIRMERQIRLLREKNEEQETVISSARAQIDMDKFPALISTPRSSTSALIRSNEITPQERKRRIKMKGEQFFKSLKVVADAHQENIHEIISNLASEGDLSYSDIVLGATDVMFSRLDAKKALTLTFSDKSHSILLESLRMPDWTYILLKVRMKISDSAWQTLLNLTQLGRSGVC